MCEYSRVSGRCAAITARLQTSCQIGFNVAQCNPQYHILLQTWPGVVKRYQAAGTSQRRPAAFGEALSVVFPLHQFEFRDLSTGLEAFCLGTVDSDASKFTFCSSTHKSCAFFETLNVSEVNGDASVFVLCSTYHRSCL